MLFRQIPGTPTAVDRGFLHQYDTLVADNASIHFDRINKNIEDWFWDHSNPEDGLPMRIGIKNDLQGV
eukprot:11900788-Ditylum_brightwellii.AAC.2